MGASATTDFAVTTACERYPSAARGLKTQEFLSRGTEHAPVGGAWETASVG